MHSFYGKQGKWAPPERLFLSLSYFSRECGMDACPCSKEPAAEARLAGRTGVLLLRWHPKQEGFRGQAPAAVQCRPLGEVGLTHPLLEDVVDDTTAQDQQGHPVPFLEAAAFPQRAPAEHHSHHLLLRDRQGLQAFRVQTPLHMAGEQAQDCTVAESSCREPRTPPAAWKEELKSPFGVKGLFITPAGFIWAPQPARIFGRSFANTEILVHKQRRRKAHRLKVTPLPCQNLGYFVSHGHWKPSLHTHGACWPPSFPWCHYCSGDLWEQENKLRWEMVPSKHLFDKISEAVLFHSLKSHGPGHLVG